MHVFLKRTCTIRDVLRKGQKTVVSLQLIFYPNTDLRCLLLHFVWRHPSLLPYAIAAPVITAEGICRKSKDSQKEGRTSRGILAL